MFDDATFSPDLSSPMTTAYDGACTDLRATDLRAHDSEFAISDAVTKTMALRIMIAVSQGERDVAILRAAAFGSVAPCESKVPPVRND